MKAATIITGTGHYVPPKVITNFDLEKLMDTSDEWIRQRAGIRERHFADPGVGASDLGYQAALKAIEDAQIEKEDIDFIIAATLSPDHYFPGIGVMIQEKLGLAGIGAWLGIIVQSPACHTIVWPLPPRPSAAATNRIRYMMLRCCPS